MSYQRRVGELTASVRVRGDYDTSSPGVDAYISDAFLMDSTSQGYKEGYELLAEADPDRLTTTATYTTTSTTGSFPLPTDLYRLRRIDVNVGTAAAPSWARLIRDDPSPLDSPWELPVGLAYVGTIGQAYRYRTEGPLAFVAPDVPANTTFRTTYVPAPVSLTGSDQTIDGTAGLDEFVVSWALRECRYREDKDTSAVDVKIDRETRRISNMGRNRDAGQAKRLEDPLVKARQGRRWGR